MSVPALSYFFQNILAYTALANLSSSVYGVLQQAKILSAAIFSVLLLRKQIGTHKWRALLLLFLGATLVEHHTFEESAHKDPSEGNPMTGTLAMLAMITLSGFAGVYYEKMLKGVNQSPADKLSVWDRNVQLAVWSIGFSFVGLFQDRTRISEEGLFTGWSFVTVFQCFLMTAGGLLVAVIIKYLDVIIKGFATAIALVVISLVGYFFLGDDLDLIFLIGMGVTIISVFNYNEQRPAAQPKPSKASAVELAELLEAGKGGNAKAGVIETIETQLRDSSIGSNGSQARKR